LQGLYKPTAYFESNNIHSDIFLNCFVLRVYNKWYQSSITGPDCERKETAVS